MEIERIQWKPIMDPSFEKLLVDRTGQSYNYHPIIILEMDDNLIFIKARSARYDLDKNENFYHTSSLKLEQREWILEDLIKNLHDKKISLTSIYHDDVGAIKTN